MSDNIERQTIIQRQGSYNFGREIALKKVNLGFIDFENEEEFDKQLKAEINKWASLYRNAANSKNGQLNK